MDKPAKNCFLINTGVVIQAQCSTLGLLFHMIVHLRQEVFSALEGLRLFEGSIPGLDEEEVSVL